MKGRRAQMNLEEQDLEEEDEEDPDDDHSTCT